MKINLTATRTASSSTEKLGATRTYNTPNVDVKFEFEMDDSTVQVLEKLSAELLVNDKFLQFIDRQIDKLIAEERECRIERREQRRHEEAMECDLYRKTAPESPIHPSRADEELAFKRRLLEELKAVSWEKEPTHMDIKSILTYSWENVANTDSPLSLERLVGAYMGGRFPDRDIQATIKAIYMAMWVA